MTEIFVNLPTLDLERSKAFYSALGATIVPEFTDANAACVKWEDSIFFMILTKDYLQSFTDKPIIDPHASAQAMTALSRPSREDVDAMRTAVLESGGGENRPPQDHGFMYAISMTDPDGNIIEFMWMDPAAAEAGPEAFTETEG